MSSPDTLTEAQGKTLEFIHSFQNENGFGPSYQEIADGLGLKAKSGVHRIIQGLCRRGRLKKLPCVGRHYKIIDHTEENLRSLLNESLQHVEDTNLRRKIIEVLNPNAEARHAS